MLPEPWGALLNLIIGPVGAVVVLCAVIFFLWRLFREEQLENRKNFGTVATLTKAVETQTIEIKAWRESGLKRDTG